jgi:hypothetical protein
VDPQANQHKRASHSGPLTHRAAWAKAGKNQDDAPKVSMGGDLSTISGLVAARRSMLSDDRRESAGSSQVEAPKLITRFPGSFKEASESLMQQNQNQKHHVHASQKEEAKGSNKDPNLVSILTFSIPTFHVLTYIILLFSVLTAKLPLILLYILFLKICICIENRKNILSKPSVWSLNVRDCEVVSLLSTHCSPRVCLLLVVL